jgi:hypothetical protein
MATKLDLLLDFTNGQGVVGGAANYLNYPADFDTNFTSIQTTTNQMVDELTAARLQDAAIPRDLLVSTDIEDNNTGNGRFSPVDVQVTYSGATLTIASGDMYGSGQKVVTAGDTFSAVRANALYYIASDVNGLLTISTSVAQSFVDVASVTVASNLWTTPFTDLLATDDQLTPLISADTTNRIVHRSDMVGALVGNEAPSIRTVTDDGTLEDAGFSHMGTPSRFGWISQKATSEGVGGAVVGAEFREKGQVLLLEQARVFAERTTTQGIVTGAGYTAITFTAPTGNSNGQDTWRREPATYLANPFIASSVAALTLPSGSNYNGTYHWTAYLDFDFGDETWVDVRIQKVVGGAKTIARVRVPTTGATETSVCLSGYMDMVGADSVQLEIDHDGTGTQDVTFARCCGMLVGGPVTPT